MKQEAVETALDGPVDGKFYFKNRADGSRDQTTVVCKLCHKEFAYHRSTSSLKYHLKAKHSAASVGASAGANPEASPARGAGRTARTNPHTLNRTSSGVRARITAKSTSEKLTNALAHWIALDCRPLGVLEDGGLQNVLRVATSDPTYELPCRETVVRRLQQLYDNEKPAIEKLLEAAECVALTGDRWTSLSHAHYHSVTAHFIDPQWRLHSLALGVQKTTTTAGHVKTEDGLEPVAAEDDFESVAEAWRLTPKLTTVGTDRDPGVTPTPAPPHPMPCVARLLHAAITAACLADSGFAATLATCREVVAACFTHGASITEELQQEREPLLPQLLQEEDRNWNCWNSTLGVVSALLRNREAVELALAKRKRHGVAALTAEEWERLRRLEGLLEPCR